MVDYKVYVPVITTFDNEGRMFPKEITWEDGTIYEIDKILDIRHAAAVKAGSTGDRYTVSIKGKKSYLFFERYADTSNPNVGRWFVERKA